MSKLNIDANKAHCFELVNQSRRIVSRGRTCKPHFDHSLCWEETTIDTMATQECPFKFCSDCELPLQERMVTRHCLSNGTWSEPNYNQCVHIFFNTTCIEKTCRPCVDPFRQIIMNVTLILSILSVLTLILSITLFAFLRSIHCRRLTIHAHLALAFVLRFSTYTVWILLQRDQVLQGCSGGLKRETGDWLCKTILFFIMYSTLASTFWMFVEGAYLVSRFSVYAMRATDGPLCLYFIVGWVLPLIFVFLWSLALESQPVVEFCWVPYTTTWALWLLVVPMSAALILNVLFLIIVIAVVIKKAKTPGSSESTKLWQTIKATLLLVPLLGVTNLLLFYEPSEKGTMAFQVYLLITAALQHSQGIFVAILYCFANGEVQHALRREFQKFTLSRQIVRRKTSERSFTIASNTETSPISPAVDVDQNDICGSRKNKCNQCKRQRKLFAGIGRVNAVCNDNMAVFTKRKPFPTNLISTPFLSKSTPVMNKAKYESCIIYNSKTPKVIITAPDDE